MIILMIGMEEKRKTCKLEYYGKNSLIQNISLEFALTQMIK